MTTEKIIALKATAHDLVCLARLEAALTARLGRPATTADVLRRGYEALAGLLGVELPPQPDSLQALAAGKRNPKKTGKGA